MPKVGKGKKAKHYAYTKKGRAAAEAEAARTGQTVAHENTAYTERLQRLLVEKNWIQGAVNPAHKGFCTPMTKSTCTPRRKALAMRFKKAGRKEKRSGGTGWEGKV